MRLFFRVGWVGSLIVFATVLAASTGWAAQATVKVKDGRSVTGEIVAEDAKSITLLISGIRTPIQRDQIDTIDYPRSTEQEYVDRRAKLAENDLDGRYELAKWLYDQNADALALKELDELSTRFPDDARVTILKAAVTGRIKLQQEDQAVTPAREVSPRPTAPPKKDPVDPGETVPIGMPDTKLTSEQINLIKLYEADLTTKPVVIVPRDVIDEMFEKYQSSDLTPKGNSEQAAFRRAKGHEQLTLLFRLRARDLYPRVSVKVDPPAIKEFRTTLHQQYVISYCGANGCHGDASGGGLFLFRTSPNTDPTVYTNFFILHRFETPAAYMLDRDEPTKSLLLQYGMAKELATTPHPDVPGYAPQIRLATDPRIRMITDFVSKLFKPAPNYEIDYTPPTPGSKTSPAPDPQPGDEPVMGEPAKP